ncbi:MAG: hypothetical protein EOO77_34790 [Oxalobacteraceae bacterium]|nr:MAG: hypothetical protein EOO77_34790 [Oxalobacteraceae bacterium]
MSKKLRHALYDGLDPIEHRALVIAKIIYEEVFEPGVTSLEGFVTPSFDNARAWKLTGYVQARKAAERIVQANQKGKL